MELSSPTAEKSILQMKADSPIESSTDTFEKSEKS